MKDDHNSGSLGGGGTKEKHCLSPFGLLEQRTISWGLESAEKYFSQ